MATMKQENPAGGARGPESSLAHDLNNLLQVVMSSLELLSRKREYSPEVVSSALRAARRAAELADRLGTIVRLQPFAAQPLDLNACVADLRPLVERAAGEEIKVRFSAGSELRSARCDARALRVALGEIAAAVREALPSGGSLELSTANAPQGMVRLELRYGAAALAAESLFYSAWCARQAGGRLHIAEGAVSLYFPA